VIKQGGIDEAAIDGVNERIDNMINRSNFLVTDWFPRGEIVKKQWYIDNNFVDLQGRDLRCLNYRFVSWWGASLDAGTDVRIRNQLHSRTLYDFIFDPQLAEN
jgi:hypothetical protein